jgi:uncharacterized membrane protein
MTQPRAGPGAAARAALHTGVVFGVALMGALDAIVFHQLLQWHHLYVHTTPFWRVFSDGLLHLFTALMWLLGAALLWSQRRRVGVLTSSRPFVAGILVGMGAFQTFDGTVNHKLLRLHPVRVGADPIWPYDLAWILSGLALLGLGWLLWRCVRPEGAEAPGL